MNDKRLIGSWIAKEIKIRGKTSPVLVGMVATFGPSLFWWTLQDNESELFRYHSDPSKVPCELDLYGNDENEEMSPAIYKIIGNEMYYCTSNSGLERPTSFDSSGGDWASSRFTRLPSSPVRKDGLVV